MELVGCDGGAMDVQNDDLYKSYDTRVPYCILRIGSIYVGIH
jgi:hypothetical protein